MSNSQEKSWTEKFVDSLLDPERVSKLMQDIGTMGLQQATKNTINY